MQEILATLSSVVMMAVVFIYYKQVSSGGSTPNPATWFICLVVMTMNVVTYYSVSNDNVWPVLTPTVITFGIMFILIYSSCKGRLGKLGWVEWLTLCLAVVVYIFQKVTGDNANSNLMIQVILLISFVPTIVGILRGQLKEKMFSWLTAIVSYVFLIASILCNTEWTWTQLAYPFVNGIIGNGSVALAAHLKRK